MRSYAAGVLEAGRDGAAGGCAIAIDGKTLRGSVDRFADLPALQWVSAFAAQQRLVVGQGALSGEDKGSEIAAARKLIEDLGLSGKLFTLDALHCQRQTLQAAVQSGNDVLVQVKCWVPCDHAPVRSWPLFKARDALRDVIASAKAQNS